MASFIALRHFNFLSLITSKLCSPLTNLTSCTFNSSFFAFQVKVFNVKVRFFRTGMEYWKSDGGRGGELGILEMQKKIWLVFLRRKTAFFLFMHLFCCFFPPFF